MIPATFRKSERLCSKKAIASLFENGKSFFIPPFQVIWMVTAEEMSSPARVAISVSKRSFRRAVKRNLVKRRIREAYRKEKESLYRILAEENKKLVFMVIFKGDVIPDYSLVEKSLKAIVEKLAGEAKKERKE